MSEKKQLKRKLSEDSDSDSDFVIEKKETSKKRNVKKKKAYIHTGIYTDSDSSDDNIPLAAKKTSSIDKSTEKSKECSSESDKNDSESSEEMEHMKENNEKSIVRKILSEENSEANDSDSSEDIPLAAKKTSSNSKLAKQSNDCSSESEANGAETPEEDIGKSIEQSEANDSDSLEDIPLAIKKISNNSNAAKKSNDSSSESEVNCAETSEEEKSTVKSKSEEKPKIDEFSDSSDIPLAVKTISARNGSPKKETNGNLETMSDKIESGSSSDNDEPIIKFSKSSKENRLSKREIVSSDSSDNEPLDEKKKKQNSNDQENRSGSSSDDDVPIKLPKSSKENGISKREIISSDSSDDEPLDEKRKKQLSNKQKNRSDSSFGDAKPKSKLNKSSKKNGISKKANVSSDSSDDEPLEKKRKKQNSDEQKNGDKSSDEDEPLSNLKASKQKNQKQQTKHSTNDKIENLKKYLRLTGIRINSYDKLFADCKSIKAKTEKLLSLLHEKGLKGRPTIEKCKKLREKLETKKEIAELDTSNIIETQGRPKRGVGSYTKREENNQSSPAIKKFSRLKDIVDSEESD